MPAVMEAVTHIHADEHMGANSLELDQRHESPEGFTYYSTDTRVSDIIAETRPADIETLREKFKNLEFNNIGFSVFSREQNLSSESHFYVLLHGWTATRRVFSDVRQSQEDPSLVEQIMSADPQAVIITPDGNGFGESTFVETLSPEELGQKCTAEAYAEQIRFLLEDVLGLEPEEVTVGGHSMGGAAAVYLASLGYKKCVASAPALFPTTQNVLEAAQIDRENKTGIVRDLKRANLSQTTYATIGSGMHLANVIGKLGSLGASTSEAAVSNAFAVSSSYLIGDSLAPKVQAELTSIHRDEFSNPQKWQITSKALLQLRGNVDFTEWSDAQFKNLRSLHVLAGTSDKLVWPEDLRRTFAVALMYANEQDFDAFSAVANVVQEIESKANFVKGGHYASLYDKRFVKLLTE